MPLKSYMLRFTVVLTTFVAGTVCYSYGAYYGGKFEAYADLMGGKSSIRVYGAKRVEHELYEEILTKEYDIEVVTVAGCIVSEQLVEKTRGYNELMEADIERRFGHRILAKVWHRAQSEYNVTP